jgi:hypothetical protein
MTRITGDVARSMVSRPYDALAQFGASSSDRAPVDMRAVVRSFGAGLLLVTGVAGAIWLAALVHAVVFRPHTVGLLERVAPTDVEATTLTLPAGPFHLPPAVFAIVGYLVLVALASIIAKLATAMLKHGVTLLRDDPPAPSAHDESSDAPVPASAT